MSGVLHVCTSNSVRSPLAVALMRHRLADLAGDGHAALPLSSAGVRAEVGQPLEPRAAAEIARRGLPAAEATTRPLTPDLIAVADLVLTASRGHRDAAAAMLPEAINRIFTWRELAHLLRGVEADQVTGDTLPERARVLGEIATRRRRICLPPQPETLDVEQPWGRTSRRFRRAARQIDAALESFVDLLVPPGRVIEVPMFMARTTITLPPEPREATPSEAPVRALAIVRDPRRVT